MTSAAEEPQGEDSLNPMNLSGLTKLVSVLAAIAYGTGVVAINTYLHELGIADFSFAKPKLLLTGVLVVFTFLLLASHLFFLAWSIGSDRREEAKRVVSLRGILLGVLGFLVLLLAASAWLCFQKEPGLGQITVIQAREHMAAGARLARVRASLSVAAEVYLPILVAALFVGAATRLYERARRKASRLRLNLEHFYFLITVAVVGICIIGYVYMFTRTFYPAIPQEFGGGRPYYASFGVPEEDRCRLQEIGVPFEKELPGVTIPLPVLHETDTLVAVWLRCRPHENCNHGPDGPGVEHFAVIQIDKSEIRSMRAYNSGKGAPMVAPASATCGGTAAAATPATGKSAQ